MTHSIKTLTSIFTLMIATAFTAQANADEYGHIDRLAVQIQRKTRQLTNELRHYRHTAEYSHLIADTNELYRIAKHVHDVTHFEGNLFHLKSDLDEMDQKFHHLEEVFDRVEHNAAYGNGHVHGNTAHVKRLLESIKDSIHHISIDVQTLQSRVVVINRPVYRPVYSQPVYTSPRPVYRPVYTPTYGGHGSHGHGNDRHDDHGNGRGHGYGGGGFTIGGGSSKIHIRF